MKKDNMQSWPNFFIVGAPRCGTTSLYEYLKSMPDIFMSKMKEPNYFSAANIPENSRHTPIRTKEKYLKLFEKANGQKIIGEASAHYLFDPDAPKLIKEVSPEARILISLRDPVERVFSHYLFQWHLVLPSFREQMKTEIANQKKHDKNLHRIVDFSPYSDNVKRYFEIFGHDHVLVVIFEEFIKNEKQTIETVLRFLNLDTKKYFEPIIHNSSYDRKRRVPSDEISQYLLNSSRTKMIVRTTMPSPMRRFLEKKILTKLTSFSTQNSKPTMDEDDKKILIDYFWNDVKQLEGILNRRLPWKNFT